MRTPPLETGPLPTPRGAAARARLLNLLPGFLAGIHLAGLIFFLNPELPFRPLPFLRAVAAYGPILAALSGILLSLATWRRPFLSYRMLPWALTAVLAAGTILFWYHASYYSYFLPPGINVRLIKAALWLSLCALICFYTALLHSLARRPYGPRSRIGLTVVALASILGMAERREAFKVRPLPEPLPAVAEIAPRPYLLLVGIDGATLEAVLPLARQGRLPFLGRMIEQGAYGRARSIHPPEPAALWTSLATGTLPYRHGVRGGRVHPAPHIGRGQFLRLLPRHLALSTWGIFGRDRPTQSGFRREVALWEVLQRLRVRTGIVGWPVTYPAPVGSGYTFSDRYFEGDFASPSARPEELAQRGALFRVEPQEIDPEMMTRLGERVPFFLLEALADDLWRSSLTRYLIAQRPDVRAVFVMLPGLAEVSRAYYGGFASSAVSGLQQGGEREAERLLTAYYQQLDRLLEGLWRTTPSPRLLAVVSPHGFRAPEGWRRIWFRLSGRPLEGLSTDAPDGLLLMLGEGLSPGTFVEGARLIDVMPTLAYGLGLPISRALDGRVLTSAFDNAFLARSPLAFVPSYDTLGEQGPPTERPPQPPAAQ